MKDRISSSFDFRVQMDFNLIMWPLVIQINLLRIHRSAFTWAVLMLKDPYQTTVHILSVHKKDRRYKDGWEMMGGSLDRWEV